MVSALFQQLSALFQLSFSLKIVSALMQECEKKCLPYSSSHQKSVRLIATNEVSALLLSALVQALICLFLQSAGQEHGRSF